MNKNKLMIRLIDIVFILLFGFIAVSQIDSTAMIEPPKSTEAEEGIPEGTQIIIIGITKDGTYQVNAGEETVLKNSNELRQYLTKLANQAEIEGAQLGVRIRAHWNVSVKDGLAVASICSNLGIPKGLDVVKYYTN